MRGAFYSVLAALLASPLAAQVNVPFETALQQVHQKVLITRKKQIEAKKSVLAGSIRNLEREARSLGWETSRLRNRISDVRRRAQRYQRDRDDQRDPDPFLRSDLRRLIWDLRVLSRKAGNAARDGARLGR